MMKSVRRGWGATLTVLSATVILTGCSVSAPNGSTSPSVSPAVGPTSTIVPGESATPTSTSTPRAGQPVGLTCQDLLSVQDLYQFNPNFSFAADAAPAAGSLAEKIVHEQGISCQYLNLSSGATIVLSVARLSAPEIAAQAAELEKASSPTTVFGNFPTNGAFFSSAGGAGSVNLFSSTYWVSATSSFFAQPDDAASFLQAPLVKLG